MIKTYVVRYIGDFNCLVPIGVEADVDDLAVDSCSGVTWRWTGARWVNVSHTTGTKFTLGAGPTIGEMLEGASTGNNKIYAGDNIAVPVELRRSSSDLAIEHNLGVVPSFVSAQYIDGGTVVQATPLSANLISSVDGNWTVWRNFGCSVKGAASTVTLMALLTTTDEGDGIPGY